MKHLLLILTVIFVTLATAASCFGEGTQDKIDPFRPFRPIGKTENPPPMGVEAEYGTSVFPETEDPIVTEVFNLNFANAKDLEKTIAALLSSGGRVGIHERLNSIVVTGTKSNLELIRQTISKLDVKAPQVMIEVLIVNVKLTDEWKMGVDWTKLGTSNDFFSQGLNITGSVSPYGKVTFSTTGGDWSFQGLVDFIETNQDFRIMANPKVLVLNNHTATIDSIEEIPYQEISESSFGGSIGSVSFKEAGIKLEVTPQITNDGYIIMHIKPEQSARTGTFTVAGNDTPIIETRRTDTTLRVRDGQTIIIGGLRRSEPSVVVNKVPILGDIPLIGMLFRSIDRDEMDSELGVFITPHIFTDGELSEEELELIEKGKNYTIKILSKEIKGLVKGLGYSDEVAQDVVNMVTGWKDERSRFVLVGWKKTVARAKENYRQGKISREQLAGIEWSVIGEVGRRIQKEIAYNKGIFDLADTVKHERADYLGYSQLLYVLCNCAGL